MKRRLWLSVLATALLACAACTGGGAAKGGTDASAQADAPSDALADDQDDAGSDAGDAGDVGSPLPAIPNQGGPVIAAPKLVTITFPGFAYETWVESFGAFIVQSTWLTTVGADYGVGAGTHVHVTLTDTPPAAAGDAEVQTLLETRLQDGTLPGGMHGSASGYVYMVLYPPGTTIGSSTCGFDSTGNYRTTDWHYAVDDATARIAYVVMGTCPQQSMQHLGLQASHELVEAMTDPLPSTAPAFRLPQSSPWTALGGEIGDLCELGAHDTTTEGGFTMQRIWSNSAALGGRSPCVPAPPGDVYFVVTGEPDVIHSAAAGGSVDVKVRGWANVPAAPWSVSARPASTVVAGVQPPTFMASSGTEATVTVSIPSGTPSNTAATVLLMSSGVDDAGKKSAVSGWPVVVEVQ
jgi:hypothetical protein